MIWRGILTALSRRRLIRESVWFWIEAISAESSVFTSMFGNRNKDDVGK